ncbi:hypothetical protein PoB_004773400 [Plakobranchus ocellatus]|uniref:RING-type domain-containing protein n=1 Tax=Plakobranchus ocellatus TaxID=259542 RepID=A0AAV4BM57_9GAST|nr:hypothetical protein PoB_004773400 [Plakobranchus ocellatus]
MSNTSSNQPTDKGGSLLQSEVLFRTFGGDAMQALRCGICMEFFEVPIVLPCGHTFCLHCLTEMCKHAIQTSVTCPLQDLRIGCPQCRVLIYASPILDRNVTCNFVIQSLIECLRVKTVEGRLLMLLGDEEDGDDDDNDDADDNDDHDNTSNGGDDLLMMKMMRMNNAAAGSSCDENDDKQTKGVNTDEARVGSKIRLVGDIEMDRIIQDVDRLNEALGKRSVLDMAYFEVDQIRRQHLHAEGVSKREGEENGLFTRNKWRCLKPSCTSISRMPPAVQLGPDRQQKQWIHLIQQQKSAQQQNQQYHHGQEQQHHHYANQPLRQQQLQQSFQQRDPTRSFGWPGCAGQGLRVVAAPPTSSLPSSSSSSSSSSLLLSSLSIPSTAPACSTSSSQSLSSFRHNLNSCSLKLSQQQLQQQLQQQQPQQRQPQLQRQEQQLLQPQTSHYYLYEKNQSHLSQSYQQKQLQNTERTQLQQQQQVQHVQNHALQPHPMRQTINQQLQQQQHQATSAQSKMAAVLPVQRPSGSGETESMDQIRVLGTQFAHPTPHQTLSLLHGHTARLDNDPAVMSYSYRAETNHISNNNSNNNTRATRQ